MPGTMAEGTRIAEWSGVKASTALHLVNETCKCEYGNPNGASALICPVAAARLRPDDWRHVAGLGGASATSIVEAIKHRSERKSIPAYRCWNCEVIL
jgi:hypothetical protein